MLDTLLCWSHHVFGWVEITPVSIVKTAHTKTAAQRMSNASYVLDNAPPTQKSCTNKSGVKILRAEPETL